MLPLSLCILKTSTNKSSRHLHQNIRNRIMRTEIPPEIPNSTIACAKEMLTQKNCQQPHIRGFLCMNSRIYATVFQETRVSKLIFRILIISDPLHGRDYSQLLSEIFERVPGQRFGKDISNLFFGGNILQLHLLFKHLFT